MLSKEIIKSQEADGRRWLKTIRHGLLRDRQSSSELLQTDDTEISKFIRNNPLSIKKWKGRLETKILEVLYDFKNS